MIEAATVASMPELPSHLQVKTLIHELTHLYSNVLDAPLNERQTNAVENIIWLMMRENPDLLEALRELQ